MGERAFEHVCVCAVSERCSSSLRKPGSVSAPAYLGGEGDGGGGEGGIGGEGLGGGGEGGAGGGGGLRRDPGNKSQSQC